jgi:carboxyl-terminal processing protease
MRQTVFTAWLAGLLVLSGAPMAAEPAPASSEETGLPLSELRIFAEVFGRIKADYVEPVNDRQLLKYAIQGMLDGLDPHSAYLSEEDYADLQVGTSGKFGGLGIEIGMEDGFVKVIAPIDDTPAQRAGVMAGDLIVRIDDEPVKGMSLDEAVKRMRGEVGTEIVLTIAREGEDKPLRITIVRDIIRVVSVKQRLLEPGFGYVRISQFQTGSPQDLLHGISKLKEENSGPLKGLVLDLRNNPGGVLNAAVAISDAFLEGGLVVYTEGRVKNAEQRFEAGPDDVLEGAPLVVLINGGSASASEIVAGALQDHRRAVIMGQQSFGKGSVQTIVPVDDRNAIKLTTARYFTPHGRSIQAEGIVPDIPLATVRVAARDAGEELRLKERDLAGHISNGNGREAEKSKAEPGKEGSSLAERDYELSEALNLLKGLAILRPGAAE